VSEGDRVGPVLAVDLGGSLIRVAIYDERAGTLAQAAEPTRGSDAAEILDRIVAIAGQLGDGMKLAAAGVGVPGVPDPVSGRVSHAPNVLGLGGVDVRSRLEDALQTPVVVENDVNMGTLGEGWMGCAQGLRDYAFAAIGTGIGLGIVAGGQLVRGAHGAAGEIAWLPFGGDPFDPATQERGAVEEMVGGAAITARYRARARREVTGEDVFAASQGDDAWARLVVADQVRTLALVVASVRCILDPEVVVIGGGIGRRADVLDALRRQLGLLGEDPQRIRPCGLGERASLVGAAFAAFGAAASRGDRVDGRSSLSAEPSP
jgi:predicted NBD/HSP70 family sugar kinase